MANFDKSWAKKDTPGVSGKLRAAVTTTSPLKPQIQSAVNKLQVQISKLDAMLGKQRERDAQIFQKVIFAVQRHDTIEGRALSNELAEIRKVTSMLTNARIALERVRLRLTTIHDLGDAMVEIQPILTVMKGLQTSVGKFMPEADTELNKMTQTLGGLMADSSAETTFNMGTEASNEDTDKILQEASAIAEQKIGDRFPSVPTPGLSDTTTTTYE